MEYEAILYQVEGTVATITMNRPEMANAQDTRLIDEMDARLRPRPMPTTRSGW